MVYGMFFLGRHFLSILLCTLKSLKKLKPKTFSKNLGFLGLNYSEYLPSIGVFSGAVISAYHKVQPVGKSQQEGGERSKGNGEVTSVSDSRRHSLYSFQLGTS